jgi:hypothetical protein
MVNNLQDYYLSGLGPIFLYSESKAALLGKLLCSILRRKDEGEGGGGENHLLGRFISITTLPVVYTDQVQHAGVGIGRS